MARKTPLKKRTPYPCNPMILACGSVEEAQEQSKLSPFRLMVHGEKGSWVEDHILCPSPDCPIRRDQELFENMSLVDLTNLRARRVKAMNAEMFWKDGLTTLAQENGQREGGSYTKYRYGIETREGVITVWYDAYTGWTLTVDVGAKRVLNIERFESKAFIIPGPWMDVLRPEIVKARKGVEFRRQAQTLKDRTEVINTLR